MTDLPDECKGTGPCYMFKETEYADGCRMKCRLQHKQASRKGGLVLALLTLTGTAPKDIP